MAIDYTRAKLRLNRSKIIWFRNELGRPYSYYKLNPFQNRNNWSRNGGIREANRLRLHCNNDFYRWNSPSLQAEWALELSCRTPSEEGDQQFHALSLSLRFKVPSSVRTWLSLSRIGTIGLRRLTASVQKTLRTSPLTTAPALILVRLIYRFS